MSDITKDDLRLPGKLLSQAELHTMWSLTRPPTDEEFDRLAREAGYIKVDILNRDGTTGHRLWNWRSLPTGWRPKMRVEPVRAVWPLPRWVWHLLRLMPNRTLRYEWAIPVPSDGVYEVRLEAEDEQ